MHNRPNLNRYGLPTKIAGVVFWGLMVVGLLASSLIQHEQTARQESQYGVDAMFLSKRVEIGLEHLQTGVPISGVQSVLRQIVEPMHAKVNFEGIKISSPAGAFEFGTIQPGQYAITQSLNLVNDSGTASPWNVTVYFPSPDHSTTTERKNLMLMIGLVVMVFGLLLVQILKHMLSQPFASMVSSAQKFANGDTRARIDETLADEFGFLARFINRALDSQAKQQDELRQALERATASEAALAREKQLAEVTLHAITDAVITADANCVVQYINPAAERLTGWSMAEGAGRPLKDILNLTNEITGESLTDPGLACMQNNEIQTAMCHAALCNRKGENLAVELSAAPMHDDKGTVIGVVITMQDVSHARQLTRQLSHQASHDALTGLSNRIKFEDSIKELLATLNEDSPDHALLYIDLDQFKIVNDTCGHMAGDELLRQLALVMQEAIRKEDLLARLGGDEFGILLRYCALDQASHIAEKLLERVRSYRFNWQDKTFQVGASIGVVSITPQDKQLARILSAADLACYAAKDMGRNRIHVYYESDSTLAQRHGEMNWVNLIANALENNRFQLYRQPIQPLSGNRKGAYQHHEILLRMCADDGSTISPDSFIAAAERYNLMPQIDRWVIRNTFAAIAAGEFGSPGPGKERMVAINLSGVSLDDEKLPEYIRACASEHGISFPEVCFEITETVAIRNLANASRLIRELRGLGCHFALDDFGSGLSSFGYLKTLPVDYLKIDGSFVRDMVEDEIDRGMVEAIHQIGQIMKIRTIAEWVEDQATLKALEEIGIDLAQGYYFGKPEPINLPWTSSGSERAA